MKCTLPYSDKRFVLGSAIAVIAFILVILFHSPKKDVTISLPQITISKAVKKSVPLTIRLPGTTQAPETVLLRSQIDGVIKQIHFHEGEIVQKDDLLYTIDDETLQAQLHQAEATFAKGTALLEDAKKETKRNQSLVKKGFITQSSFDQIQANEKSLDGETKANQAAIELAKVQLAFSKIKSPLTGLIGFNKIEAGNFVRSSENTPLVSIVRVDLLDAVLNLPERYLKHLTAKDLSTVPVQLLDLNGNPISQKAVLTARDNAVNSSSGVIPIKLRIENPLINGKPTLLPGQYIIALIQLDNDEGSLTVPLSAIQNGQNGSNVFVYNDETKTVQFRPVKLGLVTETEAVIQEGIQEGESVVTSGQIRLVDKAKAAIAS